MPLSWYALPGNKAAVSTQCMAEKKTSKCVDISKSYRNTLTCWTASHARWHQPNHQAEPASAEQIVDTLPTA